MGVSDDEYEKLLVNSINFFETLRKQLEVWRHKARLLAVVNPLAFVVMNGCMLPEYEKKLDEGEKICTEGIKKYSEELSIYRGDDIS